MKKVLLYILLGTLLTACGRMHSPTAPDGSTYPQTYVVKE